MYACRQVPSAHRALGVAERALTVVKARMGWIGWRVARRGPYGALGRLSA